MDVLEPTFVGAVALAFGAALFFVIGAYIASKRRKSKYGTLFFGIVAAMLGLVITTSVLMAAQPALGMQFFKTGADIEVSVEEGSLQLCFYDAMTGSEITSGKVYVLKGKHSLDTFDKIKDGDLKAGVDYKVMTLSTDGCATFRGMTGSALGTTYTYFYEPASFSSSGYPLGHGTVVAYAETDDSGILKAMGDQIQLYLMSAVSVFDETSTARTSYTTTSTRIDLNFKMGPTAENTGVENVYLYAAYTDDEWQSLDVYVNGHKITFDKLADLDSDNPLKKNAPSGAVYVASDPVITNLLVYDDKVDGRIDAESLGNATITLYFVQNANVEHADVQLGTFTLTIDTAATTTGWG